MHVTKYVNLKLCLFLENIPSIFTYIRVVRSYAFMNAQSVRSTNIHRRGQLGCPFF